MAIGTHPPREARAIAWADRPAADPLLEPLVGAPALSGLWAAAGLGRLAMHGLWEGERLVGGWLMHADRGHLVLAGRFGALDALDARDPADGAGDGEADRAIARSLQGRARAILAPDEALDEAARRLAPAGFSPYRREEFVQDQRRLAPFASQDLPFRVAPWDPAFADAAVALAARANAGSLDGCFLTLPDAPTADACAAALRAALEGSIGPFLPACSFMAWHDDAPAPEAAHEPALAGAVLAVRTGPTQATLFELAVSPAARGRGLGRALVQRMQAAMRPLGLDELAFLTTGTNAPVHRLFRPEEIVRHEAALGAFWVAPPDGSERASGD